VIVGKQSIDADSCQTGQMLAGLLNWPQCTFAAKLEIADDKKVSIWIDGHGRLRRYPFQHLHLLLRPPR
jgi:electron transfer flavoprotein alpha/beta subunit